MQSMTGFCHLIKQDKEKIWDMRIAAINNRFLDITVLLPVRDAVLEEKIRNIVRKYMTRGKIDIKISWTFFQQEKSAIQLNTAVLKQCYTASERFAKELKIKNDMSLKELISLPFAWQSREKGEPNISDTFLDIFMKEGIEMLFSAREREGKKLKVKLLSYAKAIKKNIVHLHKINIEQTKVMQQKIRDKIGKIKELQTLPNKNLFEQEIIALVCKGDIEEELVRLESHIAYFKELMNEKTAIGKKIGFLVQEFLRECNTIADKVSDLRGKHIIVQTKTLVEQIREQANNIE